MTSREPTERPRDPKQWRPLSARPARRNPAITDPIIEPLWQGTRVLAHYRQTPAGPHRGSVELVDADGYDVSSEFSQIVEALADSIFAVEAVIDGVLTDQASTGGIGVGVVPTAEISPVGMLFGRRPEVTVEAVREPEGEGEVIFVALDLLSVDGEPLFDLPLLERKRQLDSLIAANEYARISPFARPPIEQWLNSWKSAGFRGVVLKAANGRYRPADVAKGWVIVERVKGR